LSRVAFKMGQLVGGGEAASHELIAELYRVAEAWPNTAHSHDTLERSFRAGQAHPRRALLRGVVWVTPVRVEAKA
jgi:hypothetical protein